MNAEYLDQDYGGPNGAGAKTSLSYRKMGETSSTVQHECQGRTKDGGRRVSKSSLHKGCEPEAQWVWEE